MADLSHPEAAEGFTQATDAPSGAEVNNENFVYEVGFHIVPTFPQDGIGAVVEKIRAAIGTDAEFIAEGSPQKMTLAYVVERAAQGKREKYGEAYFGWIKFATSRGRIPGLEKALTEMKEVLRSLIIETVREDLTITPRRAVFASDRLEGQALEKAPREAEKGGEVSQAELDKSIDALVSE